jgi:RNA polymerase sigma factor (sigma-70 family)
MVERPDIAHTSDAMRSSDTASAVLRADHWFAHEVLPLEVSLMQFLQRNWRNQSEIADLRQEIYIRVYEAAIKQIPDKARQFVFTTARHLLVDRVRKIRVIPIEAAMDFELLEIASAEPGPDHVVLARDELRRMRDALEQLQPRWREAVMLGRIEGLSRREVAQRMGMTEFTAATYLKFGIAALTEILYGAAQGTRSTP